MISIKRAYDPADDEDGFRILVDRLWPRGVSKDRLKIDLWLKEVAPSSQLRKWFAHDTQKWKEFQARYLEELKEKKEYLDQIEDIIRKEETVTLVYAAKDEDHNNAQVLKELLSPRL